jgi:hypothetical protein
LFVKPEATDSFQWKVNNYRSVSFCKKKTTAAGEEDECILSFFGKSLIVNLSWGFKMGTK